MLDIMNKIFQRYLAANFILPFIVSTLFFVSFMLTFQIFRLTQLIVTKGVPVFDIVKLFTHFGISFLPLAIPLSALFATIYVFNKLSNDSEYIALRSFGVNKYQIYKPFFAVSILIGLMTFSLSQDLIPYSKKEFRRILENIQSTSLLSDIRSGQFFNSIPGITLFTKDVQNDGKNLEDVFIKYDSRDGVSKTIFAKQGEIVQDFDEETKIETIRLVLKDGNIINEYPTNHKIEKILFDVYNFPISDKTSEITIANKANLMSGKQLQEYLFTNKADSQKNASGFGDYISIKLEYWTRLNTCLQCLIFVLMGFVLGVKDVRSSKSSGSGKNLLIVLGYYVLFFGLISQATAGKIPAQVAVLVPTILLGVFSFKQFKKLDWTS